MIRDRRRRCPRWCAADHADEDEFGAARHRSETVVVPGLAIGAGGTRRVEAIEILIEVHADDGDPLVGVYVGDGVRAGLDLTTETADRLVRRLHDALTAVRATTES